jgi:hypothetical protein
MSSIPIKKGKCVDCGPDQPDKPLTAGRCQPHYWRFRTSVQADKRKVKNVDVNVNQDKKDLDEWFHLQISNMPSKCENCGEALIKFAPWAAKSYVAHILPKRYFKSVRLHVMNRIFLCLQCHGDYDNRGWSKAMTMPVWPLAFERLIIIAPYIDPDEVIHLPDCILKLKIA